MSYERLAAAIRGSFYETLIVFAALSITFIAFEAAVSRAASDTDQFTVTQSITGEISFQTDETDVAMSPDIPGQTGGSATGTTEVVVATNNNTGWTMDINFSSTTAMQRAGSNGSDYINNYSPSGTTSPTVNFVIGGSGTPGEFGYTVDASTSYHVAQEFKTDGSICNVPDGSDGVDQCWQAPSTTANQIINSTSSTPVNGATTTVRFVVKVPSSPNPVLNTGDYIATVTLTAQTQ